MAEMLRSYQGLFVGMNINYIENENSALAVIASNRLSAQIINTLMWQINKSDGIHLSQLSSLLQKRHPKSNQTFRSKLTLC